VLGGQDIVCIIEVQIIPLPNNHTYLPEKYYLMLSALIQAIIISTELN
jgi:hypothetical protein